MKSDEINRQLEQSVQRRHRQLIILSGAESSCLQQAKRLLELSSLGLNPVWLGAGAPSKVERINPRSVNTLLGNEFSAAVINTFSGFECDATAALEGTLVAGGALILITPELCSWPACQHCVEGGFMSAAGKSLFLDRFVGLLIRSTQKTARFPGCELRMLPAPNIEKVQTLHQTDAQQQVIRALVQLIGQSQIGSLLLTADRGRGKSAALGMAIASLLKNPDVKIVVSAPVKRATQVLFRHLKNIEMQEPGRHHLENCRFYPPDQLAQLAGQFDVLVIDEAAGIPLPLLLTAAGCFQHAIFATTTKGYEGAGRGFAIRFTRLLEQAHLTHRHLTLHHPFRWAPHDPLESFCNSAFILDSPLLPMKPASRSGVRPKTVICAVATEELAQNETRLRVLFGLLLQAHYKTTPNDLRHILDGQNLQTWVLEIDGYTVGAALIASEGPLTDLSLRRGVLGKRRRPTGHLLPQLLSQYTSSASALDLRIARVVRIAIHPQYQRRGLGSEFLQGLTRSLAQLGYDAVGAMFSAVPETSRYWEKNNFIACHLGARRQTSSGYRSITMLNPVTSVANQVFTLAHALYSDTVSFYSGEARQAQLHPLCGEHYDAMVLQRFQQAERSFIDSHAALARAASKWLQHGSKHQALSQADRELLLQVQNPHASISQLKLTCNLHSKKSVERQLRHIVTLFNASNTGAFPIIEQIDPD